MSSTTDRRLERIKFDLPKLQFVFSQAGATAPSGRSPTVIRPETMCEIESQPNVRDVLTLLADDYEVRRELHRIPPHVTYEVLVDGTRAICKLATHPEGDPATEAQVLQYVGRETSVPVPEILATGTDHFLAEWHDGVPQETPRVDESLAQTMGEGLASLHEETPFDSPGFPRAGEGGLELDVCKSWHTVVCNHLAGLQDWLEPIGYDDTATAALTFVRDHPDLFAGCGDPVLCHGNYLPDHVGVADGEVTCLIDFEHAIVAPGEYDIWRSALPMFHRSDQGFDEARMNAFRAGYEAVRPLSEGFEARREAYWLVDSVSYLKSLFLQGQKTGAEAHQQAETFCEYVAETIDALDSNCG